MEMKHFSHHHGLVSHQVHHGSQIQCSGCKSPASGGHIFACWQCNFFLHDQCFRASRSLNHPCHPQHPLTLVPFPTYPSASFICNTCSYAGDGFSYCCSACEFDIHLHCALMPPPVSPLPGPNCNSIHTYPPPSGPQPLPHETTHVFQSYPQPQSSSPTMNHTAITQPPPQKPDPAYPPPGPLPLPPQTTHVFQSHLQSQSSPPNMNHPATAQPPPQKPDPTYSTVVNTAPPSQSTPPKASSMIRHFSHPHFLKAMEVDSKNKKVCSACEFELSGSAYCCTEPYCTFNLHKTCFDSPQEVQHKSHLQHPLTLLTAPPYKDGFTCNACLKDGKAFAYTCSTCSYDLHIDCIQWPDKVTRPDHKHSLTLFYSSPAAEQESEEAGFVCDACNNPVHEMAWLYYCRECDFGTHLECVTSGIKQQDGAGKSQEEMMRELELNFAVLQILAQARKSALESI